MEVFRLQRNFSRADESKHFYFQFFIKEKSEKIIITFSYKPIHYSGDDCLDNIVFAYQKVDVNMTKENARGFLPVKNLITLSLDGPSGMIGNAHRHNPNSIYEISAKSADFGFKATDIVPGIYRLCISTHCIASETVEVCLFANVM